MASAKAVEAARAVNSLLHFSSGDQEALLETMEKFFCTPSQTEADNSDLDDDDSDVELDPQAGTHITLNTTIIIIIIIIIVVQQ